MKLKLYYLFLLIMFFLFNGCTSKTNTYPNKYDIKKDTVKRSRDWGYYNNRTYSTNSGISNNSYSTNRYKSSKSYSKPKSYFYNKPKTSSYKKKSYSSSRKSYSSKTRSRRR